MIVALFGAGAVLSVLGTRLVVGVLVPAAVLAATAGGPTALAGTWTAALATGLVLLGRPPRTMAIPLVGAGAALLAGASPNAALFLPPWTVATAAAVLAAGRSRDRRWEVGLVAADLPVAAAVVWTVLREGFVSWPELDVVAAALLLVGAVVRAPLAGGPEGRSDEAGLLAVRAQAVVLAVVAVDGLGPHGGLGAAVLVTGLVLAASASAVPRDRTADALLELGFVGAALGETALGWGPAGWAWGALAAGTLNHWLRVRVDAPGGRWAWMEALIARGGGIGSPFLPVGAALVLGGAGRGGALGGVAVVGVVAALAGRAASSGRRPGGGALRPGRAVAIGAAVAAGLWAPLLALPRPPGGDALVWPPAWVIAVVLLGGALGALRPEALGPRRALASPLVIALPSIPDLGVARVAGVRGMVAGPLVGLAAAAAGVWILGLLRGFL